MSAVATRMKRPAKSAPLQRPNQAPLSRLHLAAPAALLFASGLAALVYQVLWIKQLSLVVGVEVHAISTAVSAFFGGLALGSHVLGRQADRLTRPLHLYAMLEAGVAILGIATTLALAHSGSLFARLEEQFGAASWLLPFLLVGAPAFLMGGTLPVLVRCLSPETGHLGTAGGRLYAANTAGAIAGTLLVPFALIPLFGVRGAAFAAAAVNLAAAAFAWFLGNNHPARTVADGVKAPARLPGAKLALLLYAAAGGIALGYEVIWTQAVVQWTSTRTFAFSIVLATYLVGLTLGSACFARRADRSRDPWGDFGFLISAAGITAVLALAFAGNWLGMVQVKAATVAFHLFHRESFAMAARFLVAAGWLVFVPTLFLGAAFPAALRLVVSKDSPGRDTGRIVAWNTLGGILGTLLAGFVMVPALGLERSLVLMAIGAATVGAIAVWKGTGVQPSRRWITLGIGGVAIASLALLPADHLATLLAKARGGTLAFHEASVGGTVAVVEQKSGSNSFHRLYIQGVSNSGDSMTSRRYMRLQALLPLLIHRGEPRSALVIGLGTGITSGSLLHYPGLERRVCAELLPAVVRASALFEGNANVTSDPRMEIRLRDGRRELLRSTDRYDLITLEPPPPSAAGVVNLYSSDFYRLAASRLNPDGLVAQWLPLPTQTDADTRSLVRSFLDSFPHATLWTTELHEMLLIGSASPIELDTARISSRLSQPPVSAALREVGIANATELLATWVTDRAGLEQYAADALPTTDDRPRIEYGEWPLPGEFITVLTAIMDHRTQPPLAPSDAVLLNAIDMEQEILLRFYEAGIYAYQRKPDRWRQALAWVHRKAPDNPYYQWFTAAPGPRE